MKNIERITQFLFPLETVDFNDNESIEYSKIRADLKKRGEIIGPNDLIIAATVRANNGILVTNNTKEFERVKRLKDRRLDKINSEKTNLLFLRQIKQGQQHRPEGKWNTPHSRQGKRYINLHHYYHRKDYSHESLTDNHSR